jgi:hypothetical protein
MKRVLLICLSLVLALVGWTTVCADDGFYVIGGGGKSASVPKTGQTNSYATGDDGDLEKGVAWPSPRFTSNGNNTVTDNLTGLIWMKNANYFEPLTWEAALAAAAGLCDPRTEGLPLWFGCLTDRSRKGDWRLPNRKELESLVDCGRYNPALPNTQGTGPWAEGDPFKGVQSSQYWSSSTRPDLTTYAWTVWFYFGSVDFSIKSNSNYVWCVRGGK